MLRSNKTNWTHVATVSLYHHNLTVLFPLKMSTDRPAASAKAPSKGLGMQLGKKTQKSNQFLESLKAEGEVIIEDAQPSAVQSKSVLPPTDPITVTIEERLNIIVERNGGLRNFDLQGTLSLQILNQDDGFIQLQVCSFLL